MKSALQTEGRHVFPSAVNGSMVRVYRDEQGDVYFQENSPAVPPMLSRVLGAEILKLRSQLEAARAELVHLRSLLPDAEPGGSHQYGVQFSDDDIADLDSLIREISR